MKGAFENGYYLVQVTASLANSILYIIHSALKEWLRRILADHRIDKHATASVTFFLSFFAITRGTYNIQTRAGNYLEIRGNRNRGSNLLDLGLSVSSYIFAIGLGLPPQMIFI